MGAVYFRKGLLYVLNLCVYLLEPGFKNLIAPV